jgi:glycosyltransferase involved in cell wall biosynthesis
MTKVLFITSKLQPYRIPILNLIARNENIELTVAHSSKNLKSADDLFKEIILDENYFGPFSYHTKNFTQFCKQYEVVVSMFYLQKISLMNLIFYRRYFKLIYWGIGVRASQKNRFDSPSYLNYVRYLIAKHADGLIFYSDYVRNKYIQRGIDKNKIFVMPNTVETLELKIDFERKNSISFIGTLNKSKNIFSLLEAYKKYSTKNKNLYNLEIIGNGEEFEKVKDWIIKNGLSNKINLHGAVYDKDKKAKILSRSLLSISPAQAGLSVLESFGYGVAFATSDNAFTGGERLNILDGNNGFLLDHNNLIEEIEKIINYIHTNKKEAILMCKNAKEFYDNNRTPEIMAKGFIDAINYVISK